MADTPLVLSMLSHAIFAPLWAPLTGIYIASTSKKLDHTPLNFYAPNIGYYTGFFSLWLLRDFVIFYRTPPGSYWLQEFSMVASLVAFFVLQLLYIPSPSALFYPWLALDLVVTFVPLLSFLILFLSACIRWRNNRRNNWRTRPTFWGGVISFLIGTRRSPEGRAEFFKDFKDCIFSHSIFRKHSFEPVTLAIVRGWIASLCCGGLLVFGIYSIMESTQKGDTITDTQVRPSTLIANGSYIKFTISAALLSDQEPTNVSSMIYPLGQNTFTQSDDISGCQTWLPGCQTWTSSDIPWTPLADPNFPFYFLSFPNIAINSSNQATVLITILINFNSDRKAISPELFATESQFTIPLALLPNTYLEVTYSAMEINYAKNTWYQLIPALVVDNAVPGVSSMTLSWNSVQTAYSLQQETNVKAALQALGTVGGLFSLIDGVFALIFGRTLLSLVTGGRPISPFGMIGLVVRRKFRKLIRQQFPDLIKESEQHGLAAFVREVAMNIDFVVSPDEIPDSQDSPDEKFPQSPMV